MFGGILLLLPEEHRPAATKALVTGFTLTLNAVVTIGKSLSAEISAWRRNRAEKEDDEPEPSVS